MRAAQSLLALASAGLAIASQEAKIDVSKAPSYRDHLLSLHRSLVTISSTSGQEHEVGNFVVDFLTDKGYIVHQIPVEPSENTPKDQSRFNVVAVKTRDLNKPRLLVTSHIDVVPPHIPYEIDDGEVTQDTTIKGRGSVDAKGSVASMITAVEELSRSGEINDDDIMLAFVVGEEVDGRGMRTFSSFLSSRDDPITFDAVIFGEPTEGKLACGHKGALACTLTATGIAGHSGYPWLGKSANEVTVRALAKILDTDLGSSEAYGNTTVNIGRFDGGVAINVISESATVGLMTRVATGPEKGGALIVKDRILEVLNAVDDEAFDLQCTPGYGFIACECEVDGE